MTAPIEPGVHSKVTSCESLNRSIGTNTLPTVAPSTASETLNPVASAPLFSITAKTTLSVPLKRAPSLTSLTTRSVGGIPIGVNAFCIVLLPSFHSSISSLESAVTVSVCVFVDVGVHTSFTSISLPVLSPSVTRTWSTTVLPSLSETSNAPALPLPTFLTVARMVLYVPL